MLAVLYPVIGAIYAWLAGAAAHHKGRNGTLFATIAFLLGAAGVTVFYVVQSGQEEAMSQAWGMGYSIFGLLPALLLVFLPSKKKKAEAH